MKSGKFGIGYKTSLQTLRKGTAKLVIIAKNCPPLRKSELEYYAMLSQSAVHHFNGTNVDLGVACGRVFRASVMVITDQGDSDILQTHSQVH